MGGRLILAVAFLLAATACTGDAGNPSTIASTSPATDTSSTSTATPQAVGPGRLAVVDRSEGIVVMAPDGSHRQQVTEGSGSGDNPALYMQPVWSPDGSTLAWGQRTGAGFGVGIRQPGSDLRTTLTTPNLPFFNYWSPDGRFLGVLHNGQSGVQFQIADVIGESTSLLDEDAPFYFSWSPDSDRVVTHAGANRAETLTPGGDRVELQPTTANYLAPQWTPAGVFHVVGDRLILENDRRRRPVAAVSGLTLFVANPQGTRVAMQSTGDDGSGITASSEDFPAPTTDAVVVVDVDTGDTEIVDDSVSIGFFWSRDGEALLMLRPDGGRIVPSVWTGGELNVYTGFTPSQTLLRDTLPFFPQYAQSMSLWAPDAGAFAFSGAVDGEVGVWVQRLDRNAPTRISDGTWVAWSSARP